MKRTIAILLILCLLLTIGTSIGEEEQPMKQGDKGEEVVRVQTRLFDLGFYTYKPTGSFQTVTRSAVVAYQVAAGIMSDGTVGAETMNLLFDRSAKRVEFHAQIPLTVSALLCSIRFLSSSISSAMAPISPIISFLPFQFFLSKHTHSIS